MDLRVHSKIVQGFILESTASWILHNHLGYKKIYDFRTPISTNILKYLPLRYIFYISPGSISIDFIYCLFYI